LIYFDFSHFRMVDITISHKLKFYLIKSRFNYCKDFILLEFLILFLLIRRQFFFALVFFPKKKSQRLGNV
jgi:hypothetical protein